MKILAFHFAHDANACVLENEEIIYYSKEEYFTGRKRDGNPYKLLEYCQQFKPFDAVIFTTPTGNYYHQEPVEKYAVKTLCDNDENIFLNWSFRHHFFHATLAFYNSGFDKSYNVVIDSNGALFADPDYNILLGREHESIFYLEWPSSAEIIIQNTPSWYGITLIYALVSELIGLTQLDSGKTMGLSSYGKIDKSLPNFFKNINQLGLPIDIDKFYYPSSQRNLIKDNYVKKFKDLEYYHEMYKETKHIIEDIFKRKHKLKNHNELTEKNYQPYADIAKKVQKESEDAVIEFILKYCDFNKCKNITLSGGYALNCLNNYRLLHELPTDVNLFVEPNADDSGISIGAAKYYYYHNTKNKIKKSAMSIYNADITPDYNIVNDNVETQVG